MAREGLEAALAVARLRHAAIADGDNETYADHGEELAEACGRLVAGGTASFGEEDVPMLDELIALETQSRMLLESLMAATSGRLESLRNSGRANGAYSRSERFSVNGV